MLPATELRAGKVFKDNDGYYLVLAYEHIKMGRGTGTIRLKVRNLVTGANLEKTFITGAKVQEADLTRRRVQYLYTNATVHLMDLTTWEQFEIDKKLVADVFKYLKEGMELTLFSADDKPLYLVLPKIVDYKVVETGGSVKGTTVGTSYKDAVLENGLTVKVPLFIQVGEIIKVSTESGEYVGRAR